MPQIVGKEIGPTGYGLMGLTWRPTPAPLPQAFAAMRASLSASPPANLWNGGEFYGPPNANSLHLLAKYLREYPSDASKIVLSIKGGVKPGTREQDGSREGVRRSVEQCLKDLDGTLTKIDIFECARVDPNTPIETTMKALEELVREGKIGGVALSEVGEKTLRRAVKVTKIVAVEVELSLWSQEPLSNGVAKACAELGIPIVAYCPIGRGMLSGEIRSPADFPEGDFRRHMDRFSEENFPINLQLVEAVGNIAAKKGCTSAQLALAWVRTLSKRNGNPEIIPIPGATTQARVKENSIYMTLNESEMQELEEVTSKFKVAGGRYYKAHESLLEG